uniref:rRNA N-glycosylase n=1 Tax=Fagus sylvatica TaxID=28930 RepID=A0A2N9IS33_FAGSY
MTTIVLTEEFNVQEQSSTTWTAYRQFIERLRPRLAVRYSHNLPVLPLQENPPTRWLDLILRTRASAITLRIRYGNLYLDGYRMGTSGAWREFGSSTANPRPPQLIPGSSFLGFTGEYRSLANVAVVNTDDIRLGQQPLIDAVNTLAISTDRKSQANSLIIVIRMICESIRYARISNYITNNFRGFSPKTESWMGTLENNWGHLSFDVLAKDANPNHTFRRVDINATEIRTVEQAVAILGVLLGGPITVLFRQPQAEAQGQPMVEVFSVRINHINGENPTSLYGTITVTDGLGSQYIYNREKEDSKSIHPGDNVFLTGPARSVSAYDSFTINLALIDKNTDHEVSKGEISWNVYNTTNEYDKLLSEDVHGEYGSVTVNYVVLSDAVEATVEVTLENEAAENIYGRLTISNGVSEFESVLVQKTKVEEDKDVRAGESIRLSRSVVAVPLNSALTISYDDEIAKTTARFPAQLAGTSEKIISGKHGEINVKVNWNN